ncbi:MAG TPA: H-X9-DG-CTERM domain-containing protein [Vineibacter sp.]|nr:H-X9-DG-CTERM domain-containing protein [Vineibacter sp.]
MPIYVNRQPYHGPAFDPIFTGGVRVDTHNVARNEDRIHDWVKLQEIRVGGPQAARERNAPAISEIVMTISTDCSAPLWIARQRTFTAARIDFTRPNGRGVEVTELSVIVHQGVIDRDAINPRTTERGAAGGQYRLRYKSLIHSNAASGSPAMSQIIAALQPSTQAGSPHPGGIIVALGDGTVRFQHYSWAWTLRR